MARLTKMEAHGIFSRCNVSRFSDFHDLDSNQVSSLIGEANKRGYKKPKSANGSRARYFFAYVQRTLNRLGLED